MVWFARPQPFLDRRDAKEHKQKEDGREHNNQPTVNLDRPGSMQQDENPGEIHSALDGLPVPVQALDGLFVGRQCQNGQNEKPGQPGQYEGLLDQGFEDDTDLQAIIQDGES
jgi:hypothetical protein